MTIKDRIKQRREQLGMTQEELAHRLGYKSKATINKVELGINDSAMRRIDDYARALQTTRGWLLGDEEQIQRDTFRSHLDAQLSLMGYDVQADEAEGIVTITRKGVTYEVTMEDLDGIAASSETFLQFQLQQLLSRSRAIPQLKAAHRRPGSDADQIRHDMQIMEDYDF